MKKSCRLPFSSAFIRRSTVDVRCSTFSYSPSEARRSFDTSRVRPGSVLLIVLVVVALLALGAYTFSEFMIVEAEATTAYGREVQARAAADSGIVMAASLLEQRYVENPPNVHSNPQFFEGVLVRDSTSAR